MTLNSYWHKIQNVDVCWCCDLWTWDFAVVNSAKLEWEKDGLLKLYLYCSYTGNFLFSLFPKQCNYFCATYNI